MVVANEFGQQTGRIQPSEPATRIPHLGHAALFFALILASLILTEVLLAALHPGPWNHTLADPRLQLIAEAVAYLLTLLAAWFVFPLVWHQPFLTGLQWNGRAARMWLFPAGLLLGFLAQATETRLPIPKALPMDALLNDRSLIPVLAVLAILVAPLMEEIFFRGFLLPALANGFDYLRLPKFELPADALATHDAWRTAPRQSTLALVLASLITSVLFALIHAPQLGYTWPAVSLLAAVSLVLCFVRIRLGSVAASTLVHMSYNLSVFLTLGYVSGGFRHMEKLR